MIARLPARIAAPIAVLLLAGCAPSQPVRPAAVHERIGDEIRQAASERSPGNEAAERALLPPLALQMPKEVELEPRFDLSVVKAPAAQVFMAIVTGTRYNMLVTDEVKGEITVSLKDVTVREALESIRDLYGYEFTIKGNRIVIQPNTIQTRVFQVNYLDTRRRGSTELRVTSAAIAGAGGSGATAAATGAAAPAQGAGAAGGTGSGNVTSRVQTSTDNDFWGDLNRALTAVIGNGEGRNVVVSPQSGVIVVRALPREIRAIENYLKATQVVVERQVILEAKIIDVTLSQEYQAGVNWAAFNSRPGGSLAAGVVGSTSTLQAAVPAGTTRTLTGGTAGLGVPGGTPTQAIGATQTSAVTPGKFGSVVATSLGRGFFGLAFESANFASLLNFLETQGTVQVLSSPRIATLNNQKAVLKVGTDELFVTNVTTTTTATTAGSVSTPSLTLQPYFSGISLDVTPQIDDDDNIILHVHPAISVVQEKEKLIDLGATLGQFRLPLATSSVNETDSIVRARNGNIIAIGGLMRQEQASSANQLPGASSLGAAGTLLGQRTNTLSKRELVILIKPTVIADDRGWVRDLEETGERLRQLDPRQFRGAGQ